LRLSTTCTSRLPGASPAPLRSLQSRGASSCGSPRSLSGRACLASMTRSVGLPRKRTHIHQLHDDNVDTSPLERSCCLERPPSRRDNSRVGAPFRAVKFRDSSRVTAACSNMLRGPKRERRMRHGFLRQCFRHVEQTQQQQQQQTRSRTFPNSKAETAPSARNRSTGDLCILAA
jgi:hypothetical protein